MSAFFAVVLLALQATTPATLDPASAPAPALTSGALQSPSVSAPPKPQNDNAVYLRASVARMTVNACYAGADAATTAKAEAAMSAWLKGYMPAIQRIRSMPGYGKCPTDQPCTHPFPDPLSGRPDARRVAALKQQMTPALAAKTCNDAIARLEGGRY